MLISDIPRECNSYVLMGGVGRRHALKYFQKCKNVGQK